MTGLAAVIAAPKQACNKLLFSYRTFRICPILGESSSLLLSIAMGNPCGNSGAFRVAGIVPAIAAVRRLRLQKVIRLESKLKANCCGKRVSTMQ
jgi:hypothetical protein